MRVLGVFWNTEVVRVSQRVFRGNLSFAGDQ